jgi:hypothetical protein
LAVFLSATVNVALGENTWIDAFPVLTALSTCAETLRSVELCWSVIVEPWIVTAPIPSSEKPVPQLVKR